MTEDEFKRMIQGSSSTYCSSMEFDRKVRQYLPTFIEIRKLGGEWVVRAYNSTSRQIHFEEIDSEEELLGVLSVMLAMPGDGS